MKSNVGFNIPDYLKWCEGFNLAPCSPEEFLAGLEFASPNELPYLNQNELIWLHDIDKKDVCRSLVETIFCRE